MEAADSPRLCDMLYDAVTFEPIASNHSMEVNNDLEGSSRGLLEVLRWHLLEGCQGEYGRRVVGVRTEIRIGDLISGSL
jgi:hypothetical protein